MSLSKEYYHIAVTVSVVLDTAGRHYHPSDKMEQVTIHSLCGADRFSARVEHTHMPLDGHCVSSSGIYRAKMLS